MWLIDGKINFTLCRILISAVTFAQTMAKDISFNTYRYAQVIHDQM